MAEKFCRWDSAARARGMSKTASALGWPAKACTRRRGRMRSRASTASAGRGLHWGCAWLPDQCNRARVVMLICKNPIMGLFSRRAHHLPFNPEGLLDQ